MAPDPSLASCPCSSYLCFNNSILVKARLNCLWLCHNKWLFLPWWLVWGFFPHFFWMFVHPCTNTQLVLNTDYKFLCRSLGDLAWWWQSRCCLVCLSPSPGGRWVLGLPLSSLQSVLSLWGAQLTSSSPQLLSDRPVNQYVCINFCMSSLCASTLKALQEFSRV